MSGWTAERQDALARILERALPGDGPVRIDAMVRLFGGASRQTWSFDATRSGRSVGLILREDPAASLIDTERKLEFAACQSFENAGIPVPRALILEEDAAVLGAPFFIMERVSGAPGNPFQADAYGTDAPAIARDFFHALGVIAGRPVDGSPLAKVCPAPAAEAAALKELAHWEAVIAADSIEPQPVALAAIRALRRKPPPPPERLSIVHGDYRSGNFLVEGGRISAILDWEMAHIGDPLEDLAWAVDPMWSHDAERPLTGMARADALALWEASSGIRIQPEAFAWWAVFAAIKGVAIWTSAAKAFASGANMDLINAWPAWYCHQFHERQLAVWLKREGGA